MAATLSPGTAAYLSEPIVQLLTLAAGRPSARAQGALSGGRVLWERAFGEQPPDFDSAAVWLKDLASACELHLDAWRPSADEIAALRAHSHPGLAAALLERFRADATGYPTLLLGLAGLERALFDVHSSMTSSARASGPTIAILKDLLLSAVMKEALPAHGAQWLLMLFHPRCLAIRNLSWHGFLPADETPRAYAALCISLLMSLPPAPPRALWDARAAFDAQLPRVPAFRQLTAATASELAQHLRHWAPLGFSSAVEGALRDLAEGSAVSASALIMPALEQALRVRFAELNGCAAVARAELNVYYVTLDGFGQQRKHLLLLQERLHAQEALGRQEGEKEWGDGASQEARAEAKTADLAMDEATVPNALLAHIGPGLSALFQDLFMQLGGPNLRGKVSHGEAPLAEGLVSGRAQEAAAEAAPAAFRLLFAGVVAMAAREMKQGVSFGKGEGGPTVRAALASAAVPPLSPPAAALVAECLAFAEGYRAVFTPSARLDASLHSAEEAVAALEALDRRFAVAVGELAGAADAAAADEVSVSVIERADAAPTGEGAAVTQFTERRGKFAAGEEMARAADGPLAERLARLVALLSKAALQRRAKGEDGLNVLLTARAAAAAPPGAEVGSAGTGGGVSAVTGERECEESTTMAECLIGICDASRITSESLVSQFDVLLQTARGRTARTAQRRRLVMCVQAFRPIKTALLQALVVVEGQHRGAARLPEGSLRRLLAHSGSLQRQAEGALQEAVARAVAYGDSKSARTLVEQISS